MVHPSVPVSTLPELVTYAKANPRKISFGSAGTGTFTHLAVELLKLAAEIDVVHVPYRGAAPAVKDLLGGHIQMIVLDVPVLLPHIRSGAVKALAVTSATRSAPCPTFQRPARPATKPCCRTTGTDWWRPAGMPGEVDDKLRKAAIGTLHSAELKKYSTRRMQCRRRRPLPSSPRSYEAERAKWEPVVTAVGIKLD